MFLQDSWKDLVALYGYGPTVVLAGILALCFKAWLPHWREVKKDEQAVKLRELDVRESEVKAREAEVELRGKIASAVTELAHTEVTMAGVIKEIAVEQRRATQAVRLLQRVNENAADNQFAELDERIETIERTLHGPLNSTASPAAQY